MPKTSWTVSVCKTTNIFEFGRMVVRWRWTAHNGFILILDDKLFLLLHFSCFQFRLLDISESALPTHQDNEFGGNLLIFGHFVLAAVSSYDNSAVWPQEEQLKIWKDWEDKMNNEKQLICWETNFNRNLFVSMQNLLNNDKQHDFANRNTYVSLSQKH